MDYNKNYFMYYVVCVVQEMKKRKIKYQEKYYEELCKFCEQDKPSDDLYYPEHNNRYLKQCFYNLEEKFDRGIISKEEWEEILKVAYKEDIIE